MDMATGKPQADIAREIGITPASVCRFVNRADIKQEVEKEAMRLLEAVPDAVQNVKDLVQGMKDIPYEDYKNRELAYKASIKLLEIAGIANSQVQNQIMINILNDNRTSISPTIETLINQLLSGFPKDPLEDE